MAELKDVVNGLIEQTNSGKIAWEKTTSYWFTQCGRGKFTIWHDNTNLIYEAGPGIQFNTLGSGDVVQPLFDLLMEKYPPKTLTQDEALQDALECLTDHK